MTRELGEPMQLGVEIGGRVHGHGRGRGLLVLLDVDLCGIKFWAPHAIDAILAP